MKTIVLNTLLLAASSALLACGDEDLDAAACTVNEADGVVTLACSDGTEATFSSGTDGEDGTSCALTDNGDGTATIACDDGTEATFSSGTDGEDGTSCTVVDNGDGTRTISCEDGTTAVVSDGEDGEDGADGSAGSDGSAGLDGDSCTVVDNGDGTSTISCDDGSEATIVSGDGGGGCSVADNGDGTSTISCGDGTEVVVSDGVDGTDGESCTVADNGDGTSTIACGEGTEVTVSNGADGASCSVTDNGDGTTTLSCEDGSEITISDGADGTSCSVSDNGDGTSTIACGDGSEATVTDGVTGIILVESGLTYDGFFGAGDSDAGPARCPEGSVAVSGGARVDAYEIDVSVLFRNGTGLYSSDALPSSPPSNSDSRTIDVRSGDFFLVDGDSFAPTTTSPFRVRSGEWRLEWTHGDGVDSVASSTIGSYEIGSVSLRLDSGASAGDVEDLTGRIFIYDNSGTSDRYQLNAVGRLGAAAGNSLGLSGDVVEAEIEPDLSGFRAQINCVDANCVGTVYVVCVETP